MFSLIISLVSIVLVAALALSSVYYAGSAFNHNTLSVRATTLLNQQVQLHSAVVLFRATHDDRNPRDFQELLDSNALRQVPVYSLNQTGEPASLSFVAKSYGADAQPWVMPVQYNSTFVLKSHVDSALCAEINWRVRGVREVPTKASLSRLPMLCYYSESLKSNLIVLGEEPVDVAVALQGLGPATDAASVLQVAREEIEE